MFLFSIDRDEIQGPGRTVLGVTAMCVLGNVKSGRMECGMRNAPLAQCEPIVNKLGYKGVLVLGDGWIVRTGTISEL